MSHVLGGHMYWSVSMTTVVSSSGGLGRTNSPSQTMTSGTPSAPVLWRFTTQVM